MFGYWLSPDVWPFGAVLLVLSGGFAVFEAGRTLRIVDDEDETHDTGA